MSTFDPHINFIKEAIKKHAKPDGWAPLAKIGIELKSKGIFYYKLATFLKKHRDFIELNYDSSVHPPNVTAKIKNIEITPTTAPIVHPVTTAFKDNEIDVFILDYLKTNLACLRIEDIYEIDEKKAVCYLTLLFETKDFEYIKNSEYSFQITDFLKDKVINTKLAKEITIPKNQLSFSGKIVSALIRAKEETKDRLLLIIEELKKGLYVNGLYKFLQNFGKITSSATFQYLQAPLSKNTLFSRAAIETLIKPINDALSISINEERSLHYINFKEVYEDYLDNINGSKEYDSELYSEIANYLFHQFKVVCNATIEKSPILFIKSTSKKYNFSNRVKCAHDIFLVIKNSGEGLAKNIKISSSSSSFEFSEVKVGLLKSGEPRELTLNTNVITDNNFKPELNILVQWEELSGKNGAMELTIHLEIQTADVPWELLKRQNPYSISIIEDKNKLYGRDEILNELKANILSNNIESYKIWGQKRVGKSSIVKTLKSILSHEENILIIYRRIGGLRNTDPIRTLNDLGEGLCSEIMIEIDNKITLPIKREQLKQINVPVFNGSFYPLEKFLLSLNRIEKNLKFIFIIDEFDRINEEFFLPGNFGEVLSQSIGKGLNEEKNIGFILVGAENIQLLDRQGINYNSYRECEVDTFNKVTQYGSYKNIVSGPVSPYIVYTEDAIDRIFDITNGNPYFTNLICFNAFNEAFKNQDAYIDINSINIAYELIIKSSQRSHFEHFWGDGLMEDTDSKRERKTDIRRRILLAFSYGYDANVKVFPSKNDILKNFKYPTEYHIDSYEVEYTIAEFFRRKIFFGNNLNIRIKPLIFESWLTGPGKTLMIEGVSDLEALHKEAELELQYVLKNEELEKLSETLVYKGEKISVEEFRGYFKQFGGAIQQRRIFNLVDSIYYISQIDINEFYRKEIRNIFAKHDIEVKEGVKKVYRENIELYTFSENYDEKVYLINSFKVMTRIRSSKLTKSLKDDIDIWRKNNSDEIIIFEPIIDNIKLIAKELLNFLNENLGKSSISIRLVTLLITVKAKTALIKLTSGVPNFKLVIFKEVEESKIKPFIPETEIFETNTESLNIYAEVRRVFSTVSKETLLVLFEPLCLSKSCPILWSQSANFKPLFENTIAQWTVAAQDEESSEQRRTRMYHANTILSQKVNSFIVSFLKNKAHKGGYGDIFRTEYIPRNIIDGTYKKWLDENQKSPRESYFEFINYKDIINLHNELKSVFMIGKDSLKWIERINELRRDPAHPEKPAPTEEEVDYFEKTKDEVISRINKFNIQNLVMS